MPTDLLTAYIDNLHEGVVYEFSRFAVMPRPIILNPVDAPLMIKFAQFTVVKNRFDLNDKFPEWTFNLTTINELPPANDTPQDYIGDTNYAHWLFLWSMIYCSMDIALC